jgi:Protein of unknown function (DUF2442)
MATRQLTDEAILAQIDAARKRGRVAEQTEPRAVSARYDRETGRLELELRNGCFFAVPVALMEDLAGASPEQLGAVEVLGRGYALRWEELDVDFTVPSLLEGRFGNQRWLAPWGGSGWNAPAPPPPTEAAAPPEPVRQRKAS